MSVEFIVLSISAPADIQAVSIAFRNPATNHSRRGLCSVVEATSCPGTTRQTMRSTCNVSANQSRAKVRILFEHPHAYRVWSIVGPDSIPGFYPRIECSYWVGLLHGAHDLHEVRALPSRDRIRAHPMIALLKPVRRKTCDKFMHYGTPIVVDLKPWRLYWPSASAAQARDRLEPP